MNNTTLTLLDRVMTLVNNETPSERNARMAGAFSHEWDDSDEWESESDECCGPETWDSDDDLAWECQMAEEEAIIVDEMERAHDTCF